MVSFSLGTALSLALSLLLISRGAAHVDTTVCDGAPDVDTSELYLLQRKAHVIRKPIVDTSSKLARDAFKFTMNKTAATKCALHVQHTRTSAFVSAVRGRVVPLSHKQRLSMLSTTEASGLSEAGNAAVIAACAFVLLMTAAVTAVLAIIETNFGQIFSEIVKEGIEIVADEILGLDVTIGSMMVGVLKGSIMITDFKIANPSEWKTDCFLNANTVDIRLNLWSYVWKRFFGRPIDIEVDSVVFKDVGLNVEKSASASNVQTILAMAYGNKEKADRIPKKPRKDAKECKLTLHKMTIEDARATVPFWGHIAVPTVCCNDFDKATGGKAKTLRPIVVEILQELCNTGEWASEMVVDDQEDKSISIPA